MPSSPPFLIPFILTQAKEHAFRRIFHIINIPGMPEAGINQNLL